MITAKILADSVNPSNRRITSFLLTYPRMIHSELLTHRNFSRNSASSRAIPFKKMVELVRDNTALPEKWPFEKSGMQGGEDLTKEDEEYCKIVWENAAFNATGFASMLQDRKLHKSLCNRLLEPFAHMTVIVTSTDYNNFFALRAHPDAMPEFQVLAYRMLDEYLKNTPRNLKWGEWHIPEFEGSQWTGSLENNLKIATAKCARTSYLTFDGEHSPEKDIILHDRLTSSGHWSPTEHVAQAKEVPDSHKDFSNFDINYQWRGWYQYRKMFDNENKLDVNLQEILDKKPEWITLD